MRRDRIISLQSLTGGIGRTSLTILLARAVARQNRRCLIIDLTVHDGPARRLGLGGGRDDAATTGAAPGVSARPLAADVRTAEPGVDVLALPTGRWDATSLPAAVPVLADGLAALPAYDVALLDLVGGGGREDAAASLAGWALCPTDGTRRGGDGVAFALRVLAATPGAARPLALVPYALAPFPGAAAAVAGLGARHGVPVAPAIPADSRLRAAILDGDHRYIPRGVRDACDELAWYLLGWLETPPGGDMAGR
jgi:hypothetical protein